MGEAGLLPLRRQVIVTVPGAANQDDLRPKIGEVDPLAQQQRTQRLSRRGVGGVLRIVLIVVTRPERQLPPDPRRLAGLHQRGDVIRELGLAD